MKYVRLGIGIGLGLGLAKAIVEQGEFWLRYKLSKRINAETFARARQAQERLRAEVEHIRLEEGREEDHYTSEAGYR